MIIYVDELGKQGISIQWIATQLEVSRPLISQIINGCSTLSDDAEKEYIRRIEELLRNRGEQLKGIHIEKRHKR